MAEDPYSILEVDPGATSSEIKAAYRRLAAIYHPDRNPGFQDAANEKLKALNDAYARVKAGQGSGPIPDEPAPTADGPAGEDPAGEDGTDDEVDNQQAIAVELARIGFLPTIDRDHPTVEVLAAIVPDAGQILKCWPYSSVEASEDYRFKELHRSFTRIAPNANGSALPFLDAPNPVLPTSEVVLCTPGELIWTTCRIASVEGPWEQLTLVAFSLAWPEILGSRLVSRRKGTVNIWIEDGPTLTFHTAAGDAEDLAAYVDSASKHSG